MVYLHTRQVFFAAKLQDAILLRSLYLPYCTEGKWSFHYGFHQNMYLPHNPICNYERWKGALESIQNQLFKSATMCDGEIIRRLVNVLGLEVKTFTNDNTTLFKNQCFGSMTF